MSRGNPHIISPKLSNRLGVTSYIALASALLLAALALCTIEYYSARHVLLEDSRVQAKILADAVSPALLFGDTQTAEESIATLRASPITEQIAILRIEGTLFAGTLPPQRRAAIEPLRQTTARHGFRFDRLDVTHPITHEGALLGHVYLGQTLARLHRQMAFYGASALGVVAIALLLAGLAIARVQRTVTAAEQTLHTLAHVDAITELWNRNTFNLHLNNAIALAEKTRDEVALLLLDIDNFKAINDAIGHPGGDALLAEVAQRIQQMAAPEDIVCRLGGDEFAIVLQQAAVQDRAKAIANRITDVFAAPFLVHGQELFATCSLGISVYPLSASDSTTLIRAADVAMYHTKTVGKNGYLFFTDGMRQRAQRRAALEAGLRRAIAGNELELHFQPQYDLRTRALVGAEALLRWHSAELGTIAPAEFIPIAEDSGNIVEIGEWVLRAACRTLHAWQQRNLRLPLLSINLSSRQLRAPQLTQRLLAIIHEEQVTPTLIELELTESILMENIHHFIEDFKLLQREGVKLSIDDFGTGYSSMAYLKRLPLDRIKIDRSFIQDLPHGANDREIVAAMIAMSHNLGLRVTAEGVETAGQAEFLAEVGCDTVQGYYFGRPMPMADIEKLLQTPG